MPARRITATRRVAAVNQMLRWLDVGLTLRAGRGYYYVTPTAADRYLGSDSIYVYRAEQLTLNEWRCWLADLLGEGWNTGWDAEQARLRDHLVTADGYLVTVRTLTEV